MSSSQAAILPLISNQNDIAMTEIANSRNKNFSFEEIALQDGMTLEELDLLEEGRPHVVRNGEDLNFRTRHSQERWKVGSLFSCKGGLGTALALVIGIIFVWISVVSLFKVPIPNPIRGGLNNSTNGTKPIASPTPITKPVIAVPGEKQNYLDYLSRANTVQFDDVISGMYLPASQKFDWVKNQEWLDGAYLAETNSGLVISHANNDFPTKKLIDAKLLPPSFTKRNHVLAPSGKYVMTSLDGTPRWRHSTFASYRIFDITKEEWTELDSNILYASWNPVRDIVAFVKNSDIYIYSMDSKKSVNVTDKAAGDRDMLFGVSDWVYEEEVLNDVKAMWWSPNGLWLAYLAFDDTDVRGYQLDHYESSSDSSARQYPVLTSLKYPKPGTPNPIVTVYILDASNLESLVVKLPAFVDESEPIIIFEVTWADTGNSFFIRYTNRSQDKMRLVIVRVEKGRVSVTLIRDEFTISWYESQPHLFPIPSTEQYIDRVVDTRGLVQLALFEYEKDQPTMFLTWHDGEIAGGVCGYNPSTSELFYVVATKHGIERRIYSIFLKDAENAKLEPKEWNGDLKSSYSDCSLSPGGKWILLSSKGPNIPSQTLLSTETSQRTLINDNESLKAKLASIELPKIDRFVLQSEKDQHLSWNVDVTYPVGFSSNRTAFYPLVVHTYGGPNSQTVSNAWSIDLNTFIASNFHYGTVSPYLGTAVETKEHYQTIRKRSLNDPKLKPYLDKQAQPPAIVFRIDPRGTGFRGEHFRKVVTRQLGIMEATDVIQAVKQWVAVNSFVDAAKVGFWGWSFGGFLSTKIAELDGKNKIPVFGSCVAVAPVTHWLFYDSVYTERYMKMPNDNQKGYADTAIHDLSNFNRIRYLVMHGTADDNVHVQQTLHLLHLMQEWNERSKIQPNIYRGQIVEDNRHSMSQHMNSYWMVNRLIVDWFVDAWKEVDNVRNLLKN